ncbi:outer membrane beta-barrel protein [Paraflavitalea pollutisoli]|uniref:outer membrane beta-barrel protein n=1 Tax=Paraflavitalea pollutisoli TaxID=3034143 RepID=UPI0023EB5968|nr:outer membrane beta-barrel protein [Paraflavitalea sp. H1-2-19X]
MVRPVLWSLLCVLLSLMAGAQLTVSGKLIDSNSRAGIPVVSIILRALPDSVIVMNDRSDSTGGFLLKNIPAGKYVLQFTAVGYKRQFHRLEVSAGAEEIAVGLLSLEPDHNTLQAVVVSGERRAIQYRDDKMVMQVAGNVLYKSSMNALDILSKVPGLTVNGDGTMLLQGRNPPTLFVDGKPSTMGAEEQLAWLSALTPDQIESIEIIANPSARYDGQYKGIIDVRLKKQGLGWKGNLSTLLRQNKYFLADNSLNISLATPKLVYGIRLGYINGSDAYRYEALQHLASKQLMATLTDTRTKQDNLNLLASIDYHLHKDQVLGITFKSWQAKRDRYSDNTLEFSDPRRETLLSASQSFTTADPTQRNNSVNISYDAVLGKHRLNVFGAFSEIRNGQHEDLRHFNGFSGALTGYWKTAMQNDIRLRTVQFDYAVPFGKGTVEAGSKFAHITTSNDLRYDTLTKDNTFVPDGGRTNRFLYDEYISAAYLSYGATGKQLSYKLSLRTEHTATNANAVTTREMRKRNYLTWLPSASINYTIRSKETIGLAFTRRVTRPTVELLNPFRFYYSPRNYWVGNPYLQASVTTQLAFTYTNKDWRISAVAGREKDRMTRYPEYDPVTNDLLYLGTNLPHNDFANIEVAYTMAVTKWWKSMYNGGVYYSKDLMPYFGQLFANPVFDFVINGSQVFTLPQGWTVDASWRYKSWTGNSLYYIKPIGALDLGVQKSWLKGTLNTKLNFYDLFNTYIPHLRFRREEIINNRFYHRVYVQRLALSVNYSFGKAKTKSRQNRTTDEEGRVGN